MSKEEINYWYDVFKENRHAFCSKDDKIISFYEILKTLKELQNNWNELKKWLEEIQQEEFDINGFIGICTEIRINCILDKMQELESNND